jgi:hypothetical protein
MRKPALLFTPLAALSVCGTVAAQEPLQHLSDTLTRQLAPELMANAGQLAQLGTDALNQLSGELGALTQELGAFSVREMGGTRIVKGAPYCADAVNESVQTLADGNRIVRTTTTRWCRDGEGRTRQETERSGRKVVYLRDPVAKQNWTLDPQNKSVAKLGSFSEFSEWGAAVDASAWREYAERMREWARGFAQRMRGEEKPGTDKSGASNIDPVVITQADAQNGAGSARKDVYVIRMPGDGAVPPVPPVPPAPPVPPTPNAFGPSGLTLPMPPVNVRMLAPRGQGVQSSLGSKEFEGIKANGERTTWTIEAGKFGNEKPIVITSEKWTSPDLMLTVYARDFDPRSGETIYRLTNLKRGEPDAALFKVPGDYKVREGRPLGWHKPPVEKDGKSE